MSVDLSIPNSIIQAFMAGRQDKEATERTALEKERLKQQKEQEEARLKQQQEEFKAQHELVTKKFDLDKASHALNMLTQRQNIGKDISESGNIPPGVGNLTAVPKIQMQGGGEMPITPDEMKLYAPELGGAFSVPSHEKFVQDRLNEAIQLNEAKEAPARKTELLKQQQQLYNTGVENRLNRESREEVARIGAQSRLDAARARGTTESRARLANTFTQQFDSNPVVQNFDVIKRYKDFANQLDLKSGADDIGLVYAYSKVLDPNRVTSSEFDAAQKYAQTIANRYKVDIERLSSNQGDFLSPEARQSMLKVINDAYKINEAAYENIKKGHAAKFKNIGEDPNNWLIDHLGTKDDIVTTSDGKKIRVTKRYPDGSVDGEEVK